MAPHAPRGLPVGFIQRFIRQGNILHHRHRREHFADFRRQLRPTLDVLSHRWPFAATIALEELFGQFQNDFGIRFGRGHGTPLSLATDEHR
jgi:hypothetical protein